MDELDLLLLRRLLQKFQSYVRTEWDASRTSKLELEILNLCFQIPIGYEEVLKLGNAARRDRDREPR